MQIFCDNLSSHSNDRYRFASLGQSSSSKAKCQPELQNVFTHRISFKVNKIKNIWDHSHVEKAITSLYLRSMGLVVVSQFTRSHKMINRMCYCFENKEEAVDFIWNSNNVVDYFSRWKLTRPVISSATAIEIALAYITRSEGGLRRCEAVLREEWGERKISVVLSSAQLEKKKKKKKKKEKPTLL